MCWISAVWAAPEPGIFAMVEIGTTRHDADKHEPRGVRAAKEDESSLIAVLASLGLTFLLRGRSEGS